jgi:hypothetical protein
MTPGDETAGVEVHHVHPFQARKVYICPGCHQEIRIGSGHLVVFPKGRARYRRHWHRPCWEHRRHRRPSN